MKRFDFIQPYKSEYESFRGLDMYRQQIAVEALSRSPAIYNSHIEVVLKDNRLCIVGTVPNEEVRAAAEMAVFDSLGCVPLVNELSIASDGLGDRLFQRVN